MPDRMQSGFLLCRCLAGYSVPGHPQAWTPLCGGPALEAATHSSTFYWVAASKPQALGMVLPRLNTYKAGIHAVDHFRQIGMTRLGGQCVVPVEYGIEIAYTWVRSQVKHAVAGHKSMQACTARPVIEAVMPCLVVDEFRPAT